MQFLTCPRLACYNVIDFRKYDAANKKHVIIHDCGGRCSHWQRFRLIIKCSLNIHHLKLMCLDDTTYHSLFPFIINECSWLENVRNSPHACNLHSIEARPSAGPCSFRILLQLKLGFCMFADVEFPTFSNYHLTVKRIAKGKLNKLTSSWYNFYAVDDVFFIE
jgi:hypothetical protein